MIDATPPANGTDVDALFRALSDERRRIILAQLLEQRSPVPVEELVDSVVATEANGHVPPDVHRDQVRLSLKHNHLPKLDASDLVELDEDDGVIAATSGAYAAGPFLELAGESAVGGGPADA